MWQPLRLRVQQKGPLKLLPGSIHALRQPAVRWQFGLLALAPGLRLPTAPIKLPPASDWLCLYCGHHSAERQRSMLSNEHEKKRLNHFTAPGVVENDKR